jgi:hypothetical protein
MCYRIVQEHLRGVSVSESLAKLGQEFQINPAEDLNKLSDKELKHRKAIMDLSFEKHRLDKDHPDFVYDKEVDFSGKQMYYFYFFNKINDASSSVVDPDSVGSRLFCRIQIMIRSKCPDPNSDPVKKCHTKRNHIN